jgi:hypothetical protein
MTSEDSLGAVFRPRSPVESISPRELVSPVSDSWALNLDVEACGSAVGFSSGMAASDDLPGAVLGSRCPVKSVLPVSAGWGLSWAAESCG